MTKAKTVGGSTHTHTYNPIKINKGKTTFIKHMHRQTIKK